MDILALDPKCHVLVKTSRQVQEIQPPRKHTAPPFARAFSDPAAFPAGAGKLGTPGAHPTGFEQDIGIFRSFVELNRQRRKTRAPRTATTGISTANNAPPTPNTPLQDVSRVHLERARPTGVTIW